MHLTAACEQDASHAATLLTDAFSTASLPGADTGRSIVIRRLALGRIPIHVSPASLALHIERVAWRVAAEAVTFDAPEAQHATAVVFPDRAKPLIALARLHARRARTDAWFWPAVVPRWDKCRSRDDTWLLLLDTAHALPEAAIVAAAMVHETVIAGVERELIAAVPPGRAGAWLRLAGWTTFDRTVWPTTDLGADIVPGVAAHVIDEFGPLDDRVIWLGTMLAVHEAPPRAGDALLPAKVAHALAQVQATQPSSESIVRKSRPLLSDEGASRKARDGTDTGQSTSHEASTAPEPIGPEFPRTPPDDIGDVRAPTRPATDTDRETAPETSPSGYFTPYAGLFFVVAILARLRIASFLASHPEHLESGFPMRLLWFIGLRVGLNANDPLATALASGSLLDPRCDVLADDPGRDLHAMWLSAVRGWCKRHLRAGLKELIRRPGRVHVTHTHIDVTFDLAQIDTRVRCFALDVDPGWVPWLGRVVQFHYVRDRDEA